MDPTGTAAGAYSVALGVSGSIAAYKAPIVARLLMKQGMRVVPIMTKSAHAFLGAQTLSGLTGEEVLTELFDASFPGERHVAVGADVDLIALVPATADLLARLASGRADDLLTALCLSTHAPILVAPAMHPNMWSHPSTQRNVATLRSDGRVTFVGPVDGVVASGDAGVGRMAEPEDIVHAIVERLHAPKDLLRARVVVTAGPTVEDIDPVRFVTNRSSGKMGFAIAERAAARGARVTLIAGPVALPTPADVERVDVRGALSMQSALADALGANLDKADALVMTAAVGDYRPRVAATSKLKRTEAALALDMVPNPDLLAAVGGLRARLDDPTRPILIGFAVETDTDAKMIENARGKCEKKRVDAIVLNHASDAFGKDDNRVTWVDGERAEPLGHASKRDLADKILDRVAALLLRAHGGGTGR